MHLRALLVVGSAIALVPTGAMQASATNQVVCPMPVFHPDTSAAARMPVMSVNQAVPMPVQTPQCTNPLGPE